MSHLEQDNDIIVNKQGQIVPLVMKDSLDNPNSAASIVALPKVAQNAESGKKLLKPFCTKAEIEQLFEMKEYHASILPSLVNAASKVIPAVTSEPVNSGTLSSERANVPGQAQYVKADDFASQSGSAPTFNDLDLSNLFTRKYGDIVRFNCETSCFHIYNGKIWRPDQNREIYRLAENLISELSKYARTAEIYDSDAKSRLYKKAKSCGFNSRINALIEVLKGRYAVTQDLFDAYSNLIAVSNGVVDLRTGELSPFEPNLYLSKYTDVEYRPGSYKGSRFESFVSSICSGNTDLSQYLQAVFGYGLTGETIEQLLFLLQGSGANGKTTLIEAITNTVPELISHLPIEVLTASDRGNGAKATPELVAAIGSRFVFTSESNANDVFNEGRIKQLTGAGTTVVRPLYGKPFEVKPCFKLFLDTNFLPKVNGTDHAIWRRIRVIPFNRTYRGSEIDKYLPQKLSMIQERQAILSWLVEGAVSYYRYGLPACAAVLNASNEYRQNEDSITRFITTALKKREGASVSAGDLYATYCLFCEREDTEAKSQAKLGKALADYGVEKKNTNTGVVYIDICLIEPQL